jgi:membrane-bound lytic murein transglycosylase D
MKLFIALFFSTTLIVSAQSIEVPHKMQFADLTLTIRDDARKEIQKDVDAFTRYPKSFNIKVERARTYFPIIEKIFAEENVPEDFKFLVIQESALIADAVSVSNAVGYWQFKDFTAIEMGLRVDKHIDERMNIVASTRAAARYIKKNNTFFNNWLYALQAYQMGAGGVLRSEKESKSGMKHLDITSNTYWYVKKFLAHKIAYEGFTKGNPEVQLLTYESKNGKKTLSDIAREVSVDEEQVKLYNKWLKSESIPDDRSYAVAIPVKGDPSGIKLPEAVASTSTVGLHEKSTKAGTFKSAQSRTKINGIAAIRGNATESPASLAARAGVDLSAFLKWNDMSISDKVIEGNFYLLGKKRSRSTTAYHKVQQGESLWMVSQQYGVQLRKLRKYNRLSSDEEIKPGMTLWLSTTKPKEGRRGRGNEKTIEVNEGDTFAWEVTPNENPEPVLQRPETPTVSAEKAAPVVQDTSLIVKQDAGTVTASPDTTKKQLQTTTVEVVIPADSAAAVPLITEVTKNPSEHIVQQGETLYGIARQYKVGVMDLVNWNELDLQQGIKPGQVIRLSEPTAKVEGNQTQETPDIVHEVKPTDTVYSIARKYGVTIKELMEWNNKKDFNLSVGEKLRVLRR